MAISSQPLLSHSLIVQGDILIGITAACFGVLVWEWLLSFGWYERHFLTGKLKIRPITVVCYLTRTSAITALVLIYVAICAEYSQTIGFLNCRAALKAGTALNGFAIFGCTLILIMRTVAIYGSANWHWFVGLGSLVPPLAILISEYFDASSIYFEPGLIKCSTAVFLPQSARIVAFYSSISIIDFCVLGFTIHRLLKNHAFKGIIRSRGTVTAIVLEQGIKYVIINFLLTLPLVIAFARQIGKPPATSFWPGLTLPFCFSSIVACRAAIELQLLQVRGRIVHDHSIGQADADDENVSVSPLISRLSSHRLQS